MSKFNNYHILVYSLIITCLAAFLFFHGLEEQSIATNSDEIIHIRVTQEMIHEGNFYNTTHGGTAYYNKPPLKMWLSLIPWDIFNEGNFAYRTIDALSGCLTALAVFYLGLLLLGSEFFAFLASLVLLGSSPLVFSRHGFRYATQDSFLIFLCTLSMIFVWRFYRQFRDDWTLVDIKNPVIIGTLTGLAIMTKSAAGLLPLIITFALLLDAQLPDRLRKTGSHLLIMTAISLSIPLAYLLPRFLNDETAFSLFFTREIYQRATVGFHNQENYFYYFTQLLYKDCISTPAIVIISMLCAVLLIFKPTRYEEKPQQVAHFLLVWAITPVFLFSLVKSRLLWYIFPAFPAVALLTAMLAKVITEELSRIFRSHKTTSSYLIMALLFQPLFAISVETPKDLYENFKHLTERESKRLTIDKVSSDVRMARNHIPHSQVISLKSPVDKRANPAKGKFNVEAIYYRDISKHAIEIDDTSELSNYTVAMDAYFLFARLNDGIDLLTNLHTSFYRIIPPFKNRKHSLLVTTNIMNVPFEHMTGSKQVFDLGNLEDKRIQGFSKIHDNGTVQVRYFQDSNRASIYIPGDLLLEKFGTSNFISLGFNKSSANMEVTAELYLNETKIETIALSPNTLKTYTFSIDPGIWQEGLNEFKVVAVSSPKKKLENMTLMINWMTSYLNLPRPEPDNQ